MNEEEIKIFKNKIELAVQLFMENDQELLNLEAQEEAISHRIAFYLEPMFKGYHVDCEYNRDRDVKKRIHIGNLDETDRLNCNCDSCKKYIDDPDNDRLFRPDIVVHQRQSDDNNLIVFEIKRKKFCPFDIAKLKSMTNLAEHYKYQLGVFLFFPNKEPNLTWIINGQEEEVL